MHNEAEAFIEKEGLTEHLNRHLLNMQEIYRKIKNTYKGFPIEIRAYRYYSDWSIERPFAVQGYVVCTYHNNDVVGIGGMEVEYRRKVGRLLIRNDILPRKKWFSYDLCVHPYYREQGIGTVILEELIDIMEKDQKIEEFVIVYVDSALKFYESAISRIIKTKSNLMYSVFTPYIMIIK